MKSRLITLLSITLFLTIVNLSPSSLPGSASPAQGMENARNWFGNHAIVKYEGVYYDPSYGSPKATTKILWEKPALEYHGMLIVGSAITINQAALDVSYVQKLYFYVDRQDVDAALDTKIEPIRYEN